jgi:hypothetical protein
MSNQGSQEMGSRGNASHIVTYDKKAASSQRVLANLEVCKTTKGANATQ